MINTNTLNRGLSLAMEWGENWLKPIQSRLGAEFRSLDIVELDELNAICQEAMKYGHSAVLPLANMRDAERLLKWKAGVLDLYPWVDENNLSRLYSQSMYYAMK